MLSIYIDPLFLYVCVCVRVDFSINILVFRFAHIRFLSLILNGNVAYFTFVY